MIRWERERETETGYFATEGALLRLASLELTMHLNCFSFNLCSERLLLSLPSSRPFTFSIRKTIHY